jgi:peroxiredoxin
MQRRHWLALLATGLTAGGVGAWLASRRLDGPVQDAATATLFAMTLPDAAGTPQPLAQWRGKLLVVNFWATWCPPCVEEMPELSALYKERKAKGLQMIGIGIDSAAKVADFATKSPVAYPLAVAGLSGTELARAFGNATGGLPFTVLIDRHGRIAQRIPGRVKIDALRSAIDALDR